MTSAAKKLCFVIGPIGDADTEPRVHADWLLDGIIEPVMAAFPDFGVKRADQDPRPGLIDAQLINDLLNADLVIADLSFLNPNVYYEIGIRHMAQKPIIHMQLSTEKPPFDLSLYRAIKFSRAKFRDLGEAQTELMRAVEAVLANDYQVENPVTNARGRLQLDQHATPEQKLFIDKMDAFSERIELLEDQVRFLGPSAVSNERMIRALMNKPPQQFYGGGEAIPIQPTTMLTFTRKGGLSGEQIARIMQIVAKEYGAPTQIAKNANSLTLLIPAKVNLKDVAVPFRAIEGIEVTLTQQLPS
jgi:hypothetical protein